MKLNVENLQEWKKEVDEEMIDITGNYSDTQSDEQWLSDYYDETPQDVRQAYFDAMQGD